MTSAGDATTELEPSVAVPERRAEPVLSLVDAGVTGPLGTVFGPVAFSNERPVTVVVGPRGSGRTSLLLSLAGRMRLADGGLTVLGETRLARIRRRTGIAGFADIDALEPTVSVAAMLRERIAWVMPWYRRAPRVTGELARELLEPAFGDAPQPDADTLVRDLSEAQDLLLRIALALFEDPRMIVVDDLDQVRDPGERRRVADRLDALAAHGTAVVCATSDPRDAGLFAAERRATLRL